MRSRILRSLVGLVIVGALFAAPATAKTSDFRIVIPRISLNAPLSYTSRDFGPQVYYQDFNTLAIAGHRVTHTHPFYYIDAVRTGDPIYVMYNGHRNVFHVKKKLILRPDAIKSVRWWPGLILSACTPRHFATYRYVILAK